MKYSCGGFVVSSEPASTRPGWVRQASGVGVRVSVGGCGVKVSVGSGVKVGGEGVSVGKGSSDGEQAESIERSAIRIIVSFVA